MRLKSERFGNCFHFGFPVRHRGLHHFVIALQNLRRDLVRGAGIEGRIWIILDAELDEAGKVLVADTRRG